MKYTLVVLYPLPFAIEAFKVKSRRRVVAEAIALAGSIGEAGGVAGCPKPPRSPATVH
jgi:hypothetical protein